MLNMELLKSTLEAISIRFYSCDMTFLITFSDESTITNHTFLKSKKQITKPIYRIDILNQYSIDELVEQMYMTSSFLYVSTHTSKESKESRLIRLIAKSELLNKQLNEFQKILQAINTLDEVMRTIVIYAFILRTSTYEICDILCISKDRVYRKRKEALEKIIITNNLLSDEEGLYD